MYFSSGSSNQWKVKNTKTVKKKCVYCNNTDEHYVMAALSGLAFGFFLMPPQTKLGFRKYYLVCPVCNRISKELNKVELEHLKEYN